MADYPTNAPSDGSLHTQVNNLSSALKNSIGAADVSLTLSDSSAFPGTGFVTLETEAIEYTANNTGTGVLSGLTRGADSTTADIHDAGIVGYANVVAAHHNRTKEEVIAIGGDLRDCFTNVTGATTMADVGTKVESLTSIISTTVYDSPSSRNRLVNGDMRFDQRNEGSLYTVNTLTVQTLDCWRGGATGGGGVFTAYRRSAVYIDDFQWTQRITVSTQDGAIAATDQYYIVNSIEGKSVQDLQWGNATSTAKSVAVSFWATFP